VRAPKRKVKHSTTILNPQGHGASTFAETVMRERGLSLEGHVARTVSRELLQHADLVIVMTRSHRDALSAEFPQARERIHLISELIGLEYDVSDPYRKPLNAYQVCAADLEQLIEQGYSRVGIWLEGTPHRASRG
jgi:protein-tyrosine phosphatase